jgi:hypothetical protein
MMAISLGWLAWQFAEPLPEGESLLPLGPTLLFVTAGIIPTFLPSEPTDNLSGADRLWRDFQEAFGIVWAKRLLDRINHTARQENWSARLEAQGFLWNENPTPEERAYTQSRIDHTLRWHLRRFVDPSWIEERL